MSAEAIVAGLISGIISPFIVSWIQHKVIWQRQKKLELKHSIFEEAVHALSMWAADAMDPKLQSEKSSHEGTFSVTKKRPETVEIMEKAKGMVQAFYSPESYSAYDQALKAHISIDNVPNEDFEKRRTNAVVTMAKELGIDRK